MNQMDLNANYNYLRQSTQENTRSVDKVVLKTFENMLKACNDTNKDNPSKCAHILNIVTDMKRIMY